MGVVNLCQCVQYEVVLLQNSLQEINSIQLLLILVIITP